MLSGRRNLPPLDCRIRLPPLHRAPVDHLFAGGAKVRRARPAAVRQQLRVERLLVQHVSGVDAQAVPVAAAAAVRLAAALTAAATATDFAITSTASSAVTRATAIRADAQTTARATFDTATSITITTTITTRAT
jgi:hypothetical protein